MPSSANSRPALADRLRSLDQPLPSVVVGFDGFVDEMIRIVAERRGLTDFTAVPRIDVLGDLISRSAGHSSLREIVVDAVHPGGCAINLGDGLAALGIPVDAFATLGIPAHPAFAPVTGRFRSAHAWGSDPGRTLAFEFEDGKLMFSSVSQLADLDPAAVAAHLAEGAYAAACREAGLIALTDWTLYPHMTAIWRLLQAQVFAHLPHRPRFFIDLVDPSSRAVADIHAMLDTLPGFAVGGPVTLGLNVNEANLLARLLDLPPCAGGEAASTTALAHALRVRIGLDEIVIHQNRLGVAVTANEEASVSGPWCAAPRKSTGAGDRFNAGFALGHLLGLDAADRLTCAVGTAGFFVREARSPTLDDLATFLSHPDWPQ